MDTTTCCTRINTSGEVETQLHKIAEQDTWIKKVTSTGSLFDFDLFGSWRPCHQSPVLTVEIILFIMIIILLSCLILSKSLNACFLTTKQMIFLGLMHQKRNKESS